MSRGGGPAAAATTLGVTTEDYLRRRAAGEKWCWGCVIWHPVELFGRDRSRHDGRAGACREFQRERVQAAYVPLARRTKDGRRYGR